MKVSEIMKKIIVTDKNATVKEIAKIMSSKNVGSVSIVEGGEVIGIITERDVLRNMNRQSDKAEKIMSKNVKTIEADSEIEIAREIMVENKIKRLPVLDGEKIVGIVTITSILANFSGEDEESFLLN